MQSLAHTSESTVKSVRRPWAILARSRGRDSANFANRLTYSKKKFSLESEDTEHRANQISRGYYGYEAMNTMTSIRRVGQMGNERDRDI